MGTLLLDEPESLVTHQSTDTTSPVVTRGPAKRDVLLDTFKVEPITWRNADWGVIGWMLLMHLGCLVAPFYFTWSAFAVGFVLYWLNGMHWHHSLSTTDICRHPQLQGCEACRILHAALWCDSVCREALPFWASTHRGFIMLDWIRKGIPHSPRDGKWWSHMHWLFLDRTQNRDSDFRDRVVPDYA